MAARAVYAELIGPLQFTLLIEPHTTPPTLGLSIQLKCDEVALSLLNRQAAILILSVTTIHTTVGVQQAKGDSCHCGQVPVLIAHRHQCHTYHQLLLTHVSMFHR